MSNNQSRVSNRPDAISLFEDVGGLRFPANQQQQQQPILNSYSTNTLPSTNVFPIPSNSTLTFNKNSSHSFTPNSPALPPPPTQNQMKNNSQSNINIKGKNTPLSTNKSSTNNSPSSAKNENVVKGSDNDLRTRLANETRKLQQSLQNSPKPQPLVPPPPPPSSLIPSPELVNSNTSTSILSIMNPRVTTSSNVRTIIEKLVLSNLDIQYLGPVLGLLTTVLEETIALERYRTNSEIEKERVREASKLSKDDVIMEGVEPTLTSNKSRLEVNSTIESISSLLTKDRLTTIDSIPDNFTTVLNAFKQLEQQIKLRLPRSSFSATSAIPSPSIPSSTITQSKAPSISSRITSIPSTSTTLTSTPNIFNSNSTSSFNFPPPPTSLSTTQQPPPTSSLDEIDIDQKPQIPQSPKLSFLPLTNLSSNSNPSLAIPLSSSSTVLNRNTTNDFTKSGSGSGSRKIVDDRWAATSNPYRNLKPYSSSTSTSNINHNRSQINHSPRLSRSPFSPPLIISSSSTSTSATTTQRQPSDSQRQTFSPRNSTSNDSNDRLNPYANNYIPVREILNGNERGRNSNSNSNTFRNGRDYERYSPIRRSRSRSPYRGNNNNNNNYSNYGRN